MIDRCDVLIVGGGPAGSTCAWKLREAGLDVLVMDRAVFPRDKVCAGWITPQVIADLDLDTDEYRRGRTFQPMTGFRTGLVGQAGEVTTGYGRAVSFGIRRCEFDDYLLSRSGARTLPGTAVTRIRREGTGWVVNETIRASMLVGAGGHFCPVARWLNGPGEGDHQAPLVVARETEFPIGPREAGAFTTEPDTPALYFSQDLAGYGWCFRKQGGHVYWLYPSGQRVVDDGVVLVGDSAGLAYPQSGEGIRPAIESGLLAAMTVIEADGLYSEKNLSAYEEGIRRRFAGGPLSRALSRLAPPGFGASWAAALLQSPWFVRQVVLDRWFLDGHQPALTIP